MALGELLRTKLVPPPPRPDALPRAALVERLGAAAAPGRVVLVVAGAGWGKSTLVASWARAEARAGARVAWFSVGPGDDDPVRFWDHVVAALRHVEPDLGGRAEQLLAAPGTSTVHDVVPALLNELADLAEPVVLVVDDHHLVGSPEVHLGVGLLLTHLPATVRLVLVGRSVPPLPLNRLRGHGRLVEFGPDDLRLSPGETAELLAAETAARGTVWTAADADRVHARTEGWVTGLHLAVLSRRTRPDAAPAAVPPELTAGPHLADYLRTEVLDPLPGPLRTFLRRTAVLERFTADLAAAVTGQPDAPALLARVEQAQLFLVPLDERGEWFRYHHLFADVLHDDLARAEAATVPQLHVRAARWLAGHGQPVAAVEHALGGDDPALAADLVATHALGLARVGQFETMLAWFRALGDEACAANPELATVRALAGAHMGRPQDAARWADAAEHVLREAPLAPALMLRARVAMARWSAMVLVGDAGAALHHAEEIDRLLGDRPAALSGFVRVTLGLSQYRAGLLDDSWRTLATAESVAEDRGEHLVVVVARGVRALQAVRRGHHSEGTRLARSTEAVAQRHGLSEHFNTAAYRLALGWVALDEGDGPRAAALFSEALQVARRDGPVVEVAEVLTALAIAEDLLGAQAAARRHLAEATRVLEGCPDPGHLFVDARTVDVADAPSDPTAARVDLPARQEEILRLLADDLTSAEIADRLRLSRRTVEAHLRALYRRLGVRSRAAAVRYAVEQGVVSAPAASDAPT